MLDFFIKKMYNKYNKRTKELLKIKNKNFKKLLTNLIKNVIINITKEIKTLKKFLKTLDKLNKKVYNKYIKRDKKSWELSAKVHRKNKNMKGGMYYGKQINKERLF